MLFVFSRRRHLMQQVCLWCKPQLPPAPIQTIPVSKHHKALNSINFAPWISR